MATDDKYDRQIRLWGGHGQRLLSTSHVLLLGANGAGTETLKNLILPAVGRFTIVDGQSVTLRDCQNNFFVTRDSVGQPRAKITCELLNELNPDVHGEYIVQDVEQYVETQEVGVRQHQLVIVTEIENRILLKLAKICESSDIGLIVLRQYGMIGTLRVYKRELCVMESKPDNVQIDDLRLVNPFPELLHYAQSLNFDTLEDHIHSHIPYNIILIQLVNKWKDTHEGRLPKTPQEKEQFKQLIKQTSRSYGLELNFMEAMTNVFKCFQDPKQLRDSVQELLEDEKINNREEKAPYWLLASALKRFYESEGVLPLTGKLPDMTATTEYYITLQQIYQKKAQQDIDKLKSILQTIMTERGVFHESITDEETKLFCQSVQTLEVTRIRSISDELKKPNYEDFANEFYDPDSSAAWYVAVRAVEAYRDAHGGRYPGATEADIEKDLPILQDIANKIMSEVNVNNDPSIKVDDKYLIEMIRYSDSQLHTISAFLGGVASQEAIKLLIRQYTPLNHTFIYDGIHSKAQVFNI